MGNHSYTGSIIITCGTCRGKIVECDGTVTTAQDEAIAAGAIILNDVKDGLRYHHPKCVKDNGTGKYVRITGTK